MRCANASRPGATKSAQNPNRALGLDLTSDRSEPRRTGANKGCCRPPQPPTLHAPARHGRGVRVCAPPLQRWGCRRRVGFDENSQSPGVSPVGSVISLARISLGYLRRHPKIAARLPPVCHPTRWHGVRWAGMHWYPSDALKPAKMLENRENFEVTRGFHGCDGREVWGQYHGFRDRPVRPLRHPSATVQMVQKLAVYKALAIVRGGGARKGMVKNGLGTTCTFLLPRLLPARGRCTQDSELLRRTGRPCTAGHQPLSSLLNGSARPAAFRAHVSTLGGFCRQARRALHLRCGPRRKRRGCGKIRGVRDVARRDGCDGRGLQR